MPDPNVTHVLAIITALVGVSLVGWWAAVKRYATQDSALWAMAVWVSGGYVALSWAVVLGFWGWGWLVR